MPFVFFRSVGCSLDFSSDIFGSKFCFVIRLELTRFCFSCFSREANPSKGNPFGPALSIGF